MIMQPDNIFKYWDKDKKIYIQADQNRYFLLIDENKIPCKYENDKTVLVLNEQQLVQYYSNKLVLMIHIFTGLLYLNNSNNTWLSLVEFENTEDQTIFLKKQYHDKSNAGVKIYLCRGKFVYKDVYGYQFYPSNKNSEILMEGDDTHIFKIDNSRQIVA